MYDDTTEHCIRVSKGAVSQGEEDTDYRTCEWQNDELVSTESRVRFTKVSLGAYIGQYYNLCAQMGMQPKQIVVRDCWVFSDGTEFVKAHFLPPETKIIFDKCKINISSVDTGIPWTACELIGCDVDIGKQHNQLRVDSVKQSIFRNPVYVNSKSQSNLITIDSSLFDSLATSSHITISRSKFKALESQSYGKASIDKGTIDRASINSTDLVINRTTINRVNFNGIEYTGAAIFSNVVFVSPPNFTNTNFTSKNVEFSNVQFGDVSSGLALGTFRQLKHLCAEAGYEHGVIMFHGFELETHYNLNLKSCRNHQWPEKISSIVYRYFADYGRDLMLPFLWLIILFLFGFIFSALKLSDVTNALLASFRNAIGPMIFALPDEVRKLEKFPDAKTGLLAVWNFIQIVLSSIIWFVTILMMRSRFKL